MKIKVRFEVTTANQIGGLRKFKRGEVLEAICKVNDKYLAKLKVDDFLVYSFFENEVEEVKEEVKFHKVKTESLMKIIESLFLRRPSFRSTSEEMRLLELAKRIYRAENALELGVALLDLNSFFQG